MVLIFYELAHYILSKCLWEIPQIKKSKAVPIQKLKKTKVLRKDYLVRVKGGKNG